MKPRLTTYSTWKKYLLPNNKTYIILLGNALIIIFSLLEPIFFGKLVDQCLISKDYTNFYEILLIIALVAVTMVSNWKLFEKAGEPGWYAIIPFFNTFMMCKVVFGNAWWGCAFLAPLVCLPLFFIPFLNILVSFAVNMFVMFVSIMMHVRMALVFGRGGGVIALLILIPIVGYPVLAFGKETHYVPSEAKFF